MTRQMAYPGEVVTTRVYINGSIGAPEDAKISVFDRGFLYGDSVYEVMRSSGGHLVDLERHLLRLGRSAASLALSMPPESDLRKAVADTLAATGNEESYLRIVITRGGGEVGLDTALAGLPTLIVIAKPLVLPEAHKYQEGVGVRLVNVQRTSAKAVDPSVKSGNYLNNILALAEARKTGDEEAIMCDREGCIAEGSSSNVFWIAGEKLHTPSLAVGLLAGITRERVLELARAAGISVEEGRFAPDALRGAEEAFLTSSIRGLLPIARVDAMPLQAPCPGPVTTRLMAAYADFLAQEARPESPDTAPT
jgi:branched-chain amino acid aminotransferase